MTFCYPSLKRAVDIHDTIIEVSGGRSGVKDLGALESILTHIQNDIYYPNVEDKATHICFQVNKGHCFVDGNKRTSLALTLEFLNKNSIFPTDFFEYMENIAISVAQNLVNKDLLREIILALIYDDLESKEWLKLEIFNILTESIKEEITNYKGVN